MAVGALTNAGAIGAPAITPKEWMCELPPVEQSLNPPGHAVVSVAAELVDY